MSARDVIADIADDLRFDSQVGWVHARAGGIASADDTLKLVSFLYRYYYQGLTDPLRHQSGVAGVQTIESMENKELVARFAGELPAADYASAGWRVVSAQNRHVLVERRGVQLRLEGAEHTEGGEIGRVISIRMPSSRPYASPGFYTGFGSLGPPGKDEKLDRVYFNVDVTSAPVLFGWILRWADARALAVTVKVINAPDNYDRRDCLVAYFPRDEFEKCREILGEEAARLELSWGCSVPAFTRKMHTGIAWAQDPGSFGAGQRGFGMHRCTVVANGLNRSGKAGPQTLQQGILQEWERAGLDLDRPHLSPAQ